ncbi:MAG: IS66 family transposase, partial [Acidobacteria bacterium]|nr:IS66 family transposase [Acidobacteriota bacterium]
MEDPAAVAVLAVAPGELLALVCQLRAEVKQLRQEVSRLQRENVELRQQANYWRAQHARAVERIQELEQQVRDLQAENRALRQQAFGGKTERVKRGAADGLSAVADPPAERGRRGQRSDRPGPQRRGYEHLPARTETIELPLDQRCCPQCGQAYAERSESEDSEQIEIEVQAYRRVIRRKRYQPRCRCTGPWRIVTAPGVPKLIPKARYGVSVWVEILLDKFVSQRPTERLLEQWRLLDFALAAGTVTGGLERLEPLFVPLYQALIARQRQAGSWQGDETRWRVFVEQQGKVGHQWWLWVFLSADTVVFVLDPSRSRRVPQEHLPQACASTGVLLVDRLSSYKAMAQVHDGTLVLAFCWAHVRRDFIRMAKAWPELKDWALAWLRRIRDLYRLNQQRWPALDSAERASQSQADQGLRTHLEAMHQQAVTECADPTLRQPCRKVLTSLQEHWPGLTRFVDDPRLPLDNNAS